jgi:hypothetical protein
MNFDELSNKLNPLLNDLKENKGCELEIAERIISSLLNLTAIETYPKSLLANSRVDTEISRFNDAPGFLNQAAAYKIDSNKPNFIDLKLFHIKKPNKTNLSWLTSITSNFEDSDSLEYKNISIDFVIPDNKNSLIILISNKLKIRSLKLKDRITHTQFEIFSNWLQLKDAEKNSRDDKKYFHYILWNSFNFEPINTKFYLDLVNHFKILTLHLEKKFTRADSVAFSTRLIGRLLFSWFLKKKGLINESMNYFNGGDTNNQTRYYIDYLELLFFETLNKEKSKRSHTDKTTPYLNGGLFDRVSDEFIDNPDLTFPNNFFIEIFKTLNKYNFTTDEGSPEFQFVAIDPEMLGRIFESFLGQQTDILSKRSLKSTTGAHYTPREIVSYMCEESLIEFLENNINYPDSSEKNLRINEIVRLPEGIFRDQDQNKRRDWKPFAPLIIEKILGSNDTDSLKILDPAVGSGAFPMGMLQLLVKVISRLDYKFESNTSELKRLILSKILFGVDINNTAIEICRLRAWLSIIVDEDIKKNIYPLPNLDFKFICANSLVLLEDNSQADLFEDTNLKDKMIEIQKKYFDASHKATKKKLQRQYTELCNSRDLLENKNSIMMKSYQPFSLQSVSSFYDSELHHGVKDFNIIIANPPYLKERGNAEIFNPIKDTPLGKKYHQGKMDFWYYFLHLSLNLLNKNGCAAFITSSYWLNASGAKKLISRLKDEASFKSIVNIGKLKIFHDVAGNHMISVVTRNKKSEFNYLNIENDLSAIQQYPINHEKKLYKDIFIDNEIIFENKMSFIKVDKTLADEYEVSQGETEGQRSVDERNINNLGLKSKNFKINEGVFVLSKEEKDSLALNNYEQELLYEFIEPRHMQKWFYEIDNPKWLIYSDNERKKLISEDGNYINLKKHLDRMQPFITSSNAPYGLHRPREIRFFNQKKILFKSMFKDPEFSIDYCSRVVNSNSNLIILKGESNYSLEFLLGILNSNFAKHWFDNYAKKRGGGNDVGVSKLRTFPIPHKCSKKIEDLVKLIQSSHKDNISDLEDKLDAYVYKSYNIQYENIIGIDQKFYMTVEEYNNIFLD